ncbi:MAG: four helix bundle protein [Patescibacteria group bacterium]|nr:four helix bundle protein [Patescibacteria group bacterium]
MAKTYENLEIWKKGISLATEVYKITNEFPKEEIYGLTSQLRRAVVSISTNIAEGSGRGSAKDFTRFVNFSIGSLNEVESLLFISKDLSFISEGDFLKLEGSIKELGNLLGGFKKFLSKK